MLALAVAGCLSKPPFQGPLNDDAPRDGNGSGTLTGVSVLGNGLADPIAVTGTEFELHFPQMGLSRITLPDRLTVGGVDVLGQLGGCSSEDAVGLAIYPVLSLSAHESPTNASSTPRVIAMGPAFAQVSVTWDAPFACPTTVLSATGTSTFTAFPDGRIVRDDRITPTTTMLAGGGAACGCGTASADYFVTSFLTLQDQYFNHMAWEDGLIHELVIPVPMPNDWIDQPNPGWVCLDGPEPSSGHRRVGITWPGPLPTSDTGGTRIKPNPASTTLIYDWLYAAPTVPTGERATQSAWFVGTGADATCDELTMAPMASAFARPRQLSALVDGASMMIALDQPTGIYVIDPITPAGNYSISVEVAVTGVPAGYAVSIVLASASPPRVTLGAVELVVERDYLWQQASRMSGGFVHTLWIAQPLAQGVQLAISAP